MTDTHEAPGRPRSFDRDAVLDRIVDLFWRQGFGATTFSDIERATGLRRQSLVYAFGDKRAMFLEVLRRYRARHVSKVTGLLRRGGSPTRNIADAFDCWLEDARRVVGRGCLMVNTAGEFGASDERVAGILGQATGEVVDAFEHAFAQAQAAGEIPARIEPAALARLAVACGDGALLRCRTTGDARFAETSFDAFLRTVLN